MAEGPIEGTWIAFETLEVVDARIEKHLRFPGMGVSITRRRVTDGSVIFELQSQEVGELGAIEISTHRKGRTEMVVKGPTLPQHRQPTPEEQAALGVPSDKSEELNPDDLIKLMTFSLSLPPSPEEQELYRRRAFHQWWVIAGVHDFLCREMRLVLKEYYEEEDRVLILAAGLVEICNCVYLTNQRMGLGLVMSERFSTGDRAVWCSGNCALIAERVGDKTVRIELAPVKLTIPDRSALNAWNSLGNLFVEAQWTRDFRHIPFVDPRSLPAPVLPDRAAWMAATQEKLRREIAGELSKEELDRKAEELWAEHLRDKEREIETWRKAGELSALTTEDATGWYLEATGIANEPPPAATPSATRIPSIRLHIEDVDSFCKVKDVTPSAIAHLLTHEGYLDQSEDFIQKALEEILDVPFHKKDWSGERNDLYTANLVVGGRRIPTAFLLKGNGLRQRTLEIRDCGKNGDQLVRLFESPVELFVVQFVGEISEAVIKDVEGKTNEVRAGGKLAWYCIMNGQDTARLLSAYGKL